MLPLDLTGGVHFNVRLYASICKAVRTLLESRLGKVYENRGLTEVRCYSGPILGTQSCQVVTQSRASFYVG